LSGNPGPGKWLKINGRHAPRMKNSRTIMPDNLKRGGWFMDGPGCAIGLRPQQKIYKIFLEKTAGRGDVGSVRMQI
jgi:hypothetical protein